MAIQKNTSEVKIINWSNSAVYDSLSNLEFLNFLFSPENIDRVKEQLGENADKINIENFTADRDSCRFTISPVGTIGFNIANREEPKAIKLKSSAESPFSFTIWIQLLPVNENTCKMLLTLHTELNMMMKMMIGNKLKKGVNQIADAFTQIPFGAIQNLNQSNKDAYLN